MFVNAVSKIRIHFRLVSFFCEFVSKLKPESGSNLDKSYSHVLEKPKQTAKFEKSKLDSWNHIETVINQTNLPSYAGCALSPSAFGESCLRQDWASATPYTLAESSQFWHTTRGNSQARHETLWLVHQELRKKRDLNKPRHECWGYTRGSKVRRVFPSTFSLAPCLGFPRQECSAGITTFNIRQRTETSNIHWQPNRILFILPLVQCYQWHLTASSFLCLLFFQRIYNFE